MLMFKVTKPLKVPEKVERVRFENRYCGPCLKTIKHRVSGKEFTCTSCGRVKFEVGQMAG